MMGLGKDAEEKDATYTTTEQSHGSALSSVIFIVQCRHTPEEGQPFSYYRNLIYLF